MRQSRSQQRRRRGRDRRKRRPPQCRAAPLLARRSRAPCPLISAICSSAIATGSRPRSSLITGDSYSTLPARDLRHQGASARPGGSPWAASASRPRPWRPASRGVSSGAPRRASPWERCFGVAVQRRAAAARCASAQPSRAAPHARPTPPIAHAHCHPRVTPRRRPRQGGDGSGAGRRQRRWRRQRRNTCAANGGRRRERGGAAHTRHGKSSSTAPPPSCGSAAWR